MAPTFTAEELAERERRVKVLLETMDDYVPDPATGTGILQRDSGFEGVAPGRRVPCDVCNRTGRVVGGEDLLKVPGLDPTRPCPGCSGTRWRRWRKGEEAWDEYTNAPVRTDAKEKPKREFRLDEDLRALDGQIRKLERDAALREGRFDHERYGWEIERDRMERQASYRELRRVLGELGKRSKHLTRCVMAIYGPQRIKRDALPRFVRLADLGVEFIAREMRGEIRIPEWAAQDLKREKSLGACQLADLGWSPAKIGHALRISKKKVKRLLAERNR